MEDYNIVKVPDEKIKGLYTIKFYDKNGKEKSLGGILSENIQELFKNENLTGDIKKFKNLS